MAQKGSRVQVAQVRKMTVFGGSFAVNVNVALENALDSLVTPFMTAS